MWWSSTQSDWARVSLDWSWFRWPHWACTSASWFGLAVCRVEVRNRAQEVVRGRQEIRVEDREELGVRFLAALLQRAGLVSVAVRAAPDLAMHTGRRPHAEAHPVDQRAGVLVGGVVEHLHGQPVQRPCHRAAGLDDALRHGMFVEHRQLNAHRGEDGGQSPGRFGRAAAPVKADALDQTACQKEQDHRVGHVGDDRQCPPSRRAPLDPVRIAAHRNAEDEQHGESRGDGQIGQPPRHPQGPPRRVDSIAAPLVQTDCCHGD